MTPEQWLPVPDYEHYEVSDRGRLRGYGGLVKLRVDVKDGNRPFVRLCKNGAKREMQIGRVMLLAFVGTPPPGMECCHNDSDPAHNYLDNLRWDTRIGNMADVVHRRTHCINHHEFTPDNTQVRPGGARRCRACNRDQKVRHRQRRALARSA